MLSTGHSSTRESLAFFPGSGRCCSVVGLTCQCGGWGWLCPRVKGHTLLPTGQAGWLRSCALSWLVPEGTAPPLRGHPAPVLRPALSSGPMGLSSGCSECGGRVSHCTLPGALEPSPDPGRVLTPSSGWGQWREAAGQEVPAPPGLRHCPVPLLRGPVLPGGPRAVPAGPCSALGSLGWLGRGTSTSAGWCQALGVGMLPRLLTVIASRLLEGQPPTPHSP